MKRKVIIHKHLFKNAGTTFDWTLRNNFGNDFMDHRYDQKMIQGENNYLTSFLKEKPNIKALSSHHIWFHLQNCSEIELIPVYILRHPIERIRSVYNFEKQQQSHSLGAKMAKVLNFKEYVEWRMLPNIPATIRNFQTRYLAGIHPSKQINDSHLAIALNEIDTNNFIGIVDQFEKSMILFEEGFRQINIKLDLTFEVQNAFQTTKNINVDQRATKILEDLGELAQDVLSKNEMDMKVYNYAKEKLNHTNFD